MPTFMNAGRVAAIAALLISPAAGAQQDTTVRRDSARVTAAAGDPAIVIHAAVHAGAVRFAKQPTLRVTLTNGTVDSVRVIERRNLPDPVQPGVTYRDVYIAVEILGTLRAECLAARITGQEVPACDEPRDTPPRDSLSVREPARDTTRRDPTRPPAPASRRP